jgi:hypothetical protein
MSFPQSVDTSLRLTKKQENVIPAKAGIQSLFISGFRVKHGMTDSIFGSMTNKPSLWTNTI